MHLIHRPYVTNTTDATPIVLHPIWRHVISIRDIHEKSDEIHVFLMNNTRKTIEISEKFECQRVQYIYYVY